jgi:3-dehydroquinate dehydratase-1/3-dehydroquinate dehydratase/shikimate dehydrogenase
MGVPGRISRLATLHLGGYMSYACLSDEQATAPGQLSAAKMRALTALLV